MKLKLIKPRVKKKVHLLDHYRNHSPFRKICKYVVPPTSLAIVASLTPKNVSIKIIDENIEEIDFNEPVDLVGITITSFTAPRGYEIADIFRYKNIPVVLGGVHVGLMPEESLKHADAVVVGEAENIWAKVVEDFKKNQLKKKYYCKEKPNLKDLPIPRWDLLKNEKYSLCTVMLTRGCPHNCEFCVVKKHLGNKIRKRPIKDVTEELKLLKNKYDYKIFWFVDYNLFLDRKYVKELFKALIPLKINYVCFANTYIYKDEELLDLMSKSGCSVACLGFETINQDNLKLMHKDKINDINEYPKILREIQKYGIEVKPLFMIGWDHDDITIFKRIEDFVNKNNVLFPDIFIAGAFYGTEYYKRLEKEGRLNPNSNKYGYAQWSPKSINFYDLLFGYIFLYKKLYSYDALFKRIKGFYKEYKQNFVKNYPSENFFKRNLKRIIMTCLYATHLKNFEKFKFVFKLIWHPYSLYKYRYGGINHLLTITEWRDVFTYPYFFDDYLNQKISKEYYNNFFNNNFNRTVKINFKKDIDKFIKERYNYYKMLKFKRR